MVYKFFYSKVAPHDKKTMSGKGNAKHSSLERTGNNKVLEEELHKPVIKKFNKRKVYSQFKDNIWGVDLVLNAVENDLVKKADYNAKVTNIESQIAGVTKNTLDNIGDKTKLKAVDTSNFVLKTKLTADVNTLENKIDTVDKKIPDISGLATKTSLTSYLQTATCNSKVTEVENKVKSVNTKANTTRSDLTVMQKKLILLQILLQ